MDIYGVGYDQNKEFEMALRVNQNVSAIQVHRNLNSNNRNLKNSLEHISSGIKINRASDGPAALTISEQMRSQIAGLNQAIDNSETAVSMMQTTEANMEEIGKLLRNMRQLALHAANEGVNNIAVLEEVQREYENSLQTIDRIAEQARFGNKKLLDGSRSVTGTANGENLEFVDAGTATRDSRVNGYEVKVTQVATKSHIQGATSLTDEIIEAGERLVVKEGGRIATYVTNVDDTIETIVQNFQNEIDRVGLQIDVDIDPGGQLYVTHRKYGSDHTFQALSTTSGVLSENRETYHQAHAGRDIQGTINGEFTIGKGQIMEGIAGSKCIEGLRVRYWGNGQDLVKAKCEVNDRFDENWEETEPYDFPEEGKTVGRVYVSQNSIRFQVGSSLNQTAGISLSSMKSNHLGRGVANLSSFKNLADVDLRDFQGAQDALKLIDAALTQVIKNRGDLGAFQKNTLENNLSNLRVANENLISSESTIRDSDMAAEMAAYMKNKITTNSAAAMFVQANQKSDNVKELLA